MTDKQLDAVIGKIMKCFKYDPALETIVGDPAPARKILRSVIIDQLAVQDYLLQDAALQWASYNTAGGVMYGTMGISTLEDIFAYLCLEDRSYREIEFHEALRKRRKAG